MVMVGKGNEHVIIYCSQLIIHNKSLHEKDRTCKLSLTLFGAMSSLT